MPQVLIVHEVEDYATWKAAFDAAAGLLAAAGELEYRLLRYENEPNRIVHLGTWTSLESAKAFFQSPEVEEIRRKAGVKAPEFIYLEQLESGERLSGATR